MGTTPGLSWCCGFPWYPCTPVTAGTHPGSGADAEAVPQLIIPGAESRKRHPEQSSTRKGIMGQGSKGIETLGLAADRFGEHLAGDVGVGHTMAAAPLGVVDVVAQPA